MNRPAAETRRNADVRALYERYPYPSPLAVGQPILDTAIALDFVVKDLAGKKVLDAGCGTGHRLVGMACRLPETSFTGLDFSARSLMIAEDLAREQGCRNVRFVHGEIGGDSLGEQFDVVISTGVVHHLADPRSGVDWLIEHTGRDGLIYTWYYHPYGEHGRLLDRRLVQLIAEHSETGLDDSLIADLGLSPAAGNYGTATSQAGADAVVQAVADADAYLNPIVHTFRFTEAAEFFNGKCDWAIVNGVNWKGMSRIIDPPEWVGGSYVSLSLSDLFPVERVQKIFKGLAARDQLECIELRTRPTGFTLVAGRKDSLDNCSERISRGVEFANLGGQQG